MQLGGPRATPTGPQRARPHTKPSIVDRVAKPKYVYLAIGLVGLLIFGLAGALYMIEPGEGEAAAAPVNSVENPEQDALAAAAMAQKPTEASVAFASEPSNAQVIIDDIDKGTTPLSLDLQVGKSYRVEFIKDGFEINTQNVLISDSPAEVTAELSQARGILKIQSYPPDATISIDGEEQGTTPLTLTGLETDESYNITARLGDAEMKRSVDWEKSEEPVRDVMFEFAKVKGEHLTLKVDDLPDDIETRKRKKPRRRTYRRKRPRRTAKKAPAKQEEQVDEDLDIFGGSGGGSKKSASSSTSEEEEELNVWGGSSAKKKKSAPNKKKSAPKKKKSAPKKKAAEDDESLSIW